jgi:hypothetical protein
MIDMEVRKRDFIAATKQLGGRKFLIGFTVRLNQLKNLIFFGRNSWTISERQVRLRKTTGW